MGFFGSAANRIRDYFRRDKEEVGLQLAKGATASGYPTSGYDLLQAYGYDVLSDFLKLEHDLLCLSGDTRILVLNDGPEWVSIRNLEERYREQPHYRIRTLSCDPTTRRMVCADAFRPRKTKRDQVYRVASMRSDGQKRYPCAIKATAAHPFLMRDGITYKRVSELKPGDELMPADARFLTPSDANSDFKKIGISYDAIDESLVCRVVSVVPEAVEDVYDLSVPGYENFPAEGVIVHNSRYIDYEEMDDYPLLNTALDIYADDATQFESHLNRTLWVTSQDKTIQQMGDDLFHRQLRMDEEIWEIGRTICKYGQSFEEILVNDEGVKGLNFMAPPTVRRIEGPRGELFGFVQDFKGRFGYSPAEFQQIMANRAAMRQGGSDKAGTAGLEKVTALEDWEVVHFRLRGKHRRSLYGYCQRKSSRVSTTCGSKEIQHLKVGDKIYVFSGFSLEESVVRAVVCNGKKKVWSVRTEHRENFATAEHPFLVFSPKKWLSYKATKDLTLDDVLVVPRPVEFEGRATLTRTPGAFPLVRLTAAGVQRVASEVRQGGRYFYANSGLRGVHRDADRFFAGELSVDEQVLEGFAKIVPVLHESCVVVRHKKNRENYPLIPEYIDETFAEFFGFLIGDGWTSGGDVAFAWGEYEDLNNKYETRFREYGLSPRYNYIKWTNDDGIDEKAIGNCVVSSADLVDILHDLGFIDGAHNKRIPQWVFEAKRSVREAFIRGLFEADGWDVNQYGKDAIRFELCNYELVRDIKTLVDGLGWICGNICVRRRRTTVSKSTHPRYRGLEIKSGPGYILHIRPEPLFDSDFRLERVIELKELESDPEEVYDVEVDSPHRNFVADGLVVHNSVLEGARWIFKRLILLEDTALIYRLQRAPERYAFYVDVGDLPPQEALAYLNRVRQQHKKKKYVNPVTNKIDLKFDALSQDEDFFIPVREGREGTRIEVLGGPNWQCLLGDTRVPLVDGSSPTIQELSERSGEFELYAADAEGRIVKATGYNAHKTRNAQIWEVELDNGRIVSCTEDHPFLTSDGKWVWAEGLAGYSLLPFSPEEGYRSSTPRRVYHVRRTKQLAPVYCLTVREHGCFGIGQGVIVKNSVDDIEYFRDALFAAIKIPKAYLAQSEGVNRSSLSSEDVRFARTVLRVQRELRNGLAKVFRVHLAALNIDPLAVEYALHLTVPSAIFELAQLEVRNARADLAGRMKEFVDLYWILSNVFGLSDDEIELIIKRRDEDAEREAYTQGNAQAIVQRAVTQASIEAQAQGQVAAQGIQATNPAPELPPEAAQVAGQQAAKKPQESRIRGPLIKITNGYPKKTYYDTERKLFEGANKETQKRAEEKLDKLLKSDRLQANRLRELGHMLKELAVEARGGRH